MRWYVYNVIRRSILCRYVAPNMIKLYFTSLEVSTLLTLSNSRAEVCWNSHRYIRICRSRRIAPCCNMRWPSVASSWRFLHYFAKTGIFRVSWYSFIDVSRLNDILLGQIAEVWFLETSAYILCDLLHCYSGNIGATVSFRSIQRCFNTDFTTVPGSKCEHTT